MNKLSWLLYGVDLLDNIGQASALMFSICVAFLLFCVVAYVIVGIIAGDEIDEDVRAVLVFIKKVRNVLLLSCLVLSLPAFLIPNKKTMYLILASEIGQRAYDTPENKELLQNMRSVITRELKKLGE